MKNATKKAACKEEGCSEEKEVVWQRLVEDVKDHTGPGNGAFFLFGGFSIGVRRP